MKPETGTNVNAPVMARRDESNGETWIRCARCGKKLWKEEPLEGVLADNVPKTKTLSTMCKGRRNGGTCNTVNQMVV